MAIRNRMLKFFYKNWRFIYKLLGLLPEKIRKRIIEFVMEKIIASRKPIKLKKKFKIRDSDNTVKKTISIVVPPPHGKIDNQ